MPRRLRPDRYDYLVPLEMPYHDQYFDPDIWGGAKVPAITARRWRRQAKQSFAPIPNGRNHPFCIMLVIDALLRLKSKSYVTSARLTEHLNANYQQVIWDERTVGRILHSLAETAATYPRPPEQPPFLDISISDGIRNYQLPQYQRASQWLIDMRSMIEPIVDRFFAAQREDPHLTLGDEEMWSQLAYEAPETPE